MDWKTFLASLVASIAWPSAVMVSVNLLRNEMKELFHRISSLKYKDIQANFESGLVETEAKIVAIEKNISTPSMPGPEISSELEQLRRITEVSPRAAIMETWILVEQAAGKSGFVQGATVPRINAPLFVDWLIKTKKLPKEGLDLIMELLNLHNQAAQPVGFEITQEQTERYLGLAANVSTIILAPNE